MWWWERWLRKQRYILDRWFGTGEGNRSTGKRSTRLHSGRNLQWHGSMQPWHWCWICLDGHYLNNSFPVPHSHVHFLVPNWLLDRDCDHFHHRENVHGHVVRLQMSTQSPCWKQKKKFSLNKITSGDTYIKLTTTPTEAVINMMVPSISKSLVYNRSKAM